MDYTAGDALDAGFDHVLLVCETKSSVNCSITSAVYWPRSSR